jgi:RHH-type transcriptional regulator, proline utilization regulon repressor / proline dehydrogenase / delta 1-pyrroline-5-carboxylate dehydrogenase
MPPLTEAMAQSPLRQAIRKLTRAPEPDLMPGLLTQSRLSPEQNQSTQALALRLADGVRQRSRETGRSGLVQGLLQEFALSSQEGVALMCLAEALLRIPDAATRDALIRDKIGDGDWQRHLGRSPSLFVNAAAWGLLLTGKLVATHSDNSLSAVLHRAVARSGEPLIRKGVDMAMRLMGEQFVAGETIERALAHAREREAQGFRHSYDMLGEAALTAADAQRYFAAYEAAIHAIGQASGGRGLLDGPGISIKLSALHPRYSRTQLERVKAELAPRLLGLAVLARRYNMGFNIDAEESERLDLSLDLLELLCLAPELAGWNGLGFVIQAYQKRCPAVVDFLVDLAHRSGRRLMVRLVKGAYWDSEIKRAQVEGQLGYPVYTRKAHTDVAYIACARRLLSAPDAVFPQFATHNAQTLATIHTLAGTDWHPGQYEFQCLHGMGEPLYEHVVSGAVMPGLQPRPCRIYAPVGTHETLLAYLVRRLLENGANSSFVNRIADEDVPLEALVEDPVRTVEAAAQQDGQVGHAHPAIALPARLFGGDGSARTNSTGLDLNDEATLQALDAAFAAAHASTSHAGPLLGGTHAALASPQPVRNPADLRDTVGTVREATSDEVEQALATAAASAASWAATPPAQRADCLDAAAHRLEADLLHWVPLLVREAGKTCANAVSEVREAVDFLRYYADQVRHGFDNATHRPLGTVVCISPWNFPLAIFVGQVAAALAAGNVVLAKPAEQTPLIACGAVRLLRDAGVPACALQLLPGRGETVGAALVADSRVNAVLFTGSTAVARLLQLSLAQRLTAEGQLVPLIAETGGQNALIVDSSALAEQAVTDIVTSAFDSAGQRCSALRLLCLQNDVADRVLEMLKGAVEELHLGDPRALATDMGPVIDADALDTIEQHIHTMQLQGHTVWRPSWHGQVAASGFFAAPAIVELNSVNELGLEVFGPVLHVLRYSRMDLATLLSQINGLGYGLTQGVHTRIDETVAQVLAATRAGNVYVNRNMVGAVVGVQPFGGEGLSGTGPKAGGPLYLLRLLSQCPRGAARAAVQRPAEFPVAQPLNELKSWALSRGLSALADHCDHMADAAPLNPGLHLPGPTGEANVYTVKARDAVLCLTDPHEGEDKDRLLQFAAVLAVGSHAVWPSTARPLFQRLTPDLRGHIRLADDWASPLVQFDAVMHHGARVSWLSTAQALAARPGSIIGVSGLAPGDARIPLERLVVERSVSTNTAAAGGNASLMTLA